VTKTPVALFIFNRPQHTRRVFEVIAQARPAELFVIADGPRFDNEEDERLCRETRDLIDINWPCKLHMLSSDTNLGCRQRLASGLDWVFAQAEEAIILEDDTLPDLTFFKFCEKLLERYRDDPRVHMICGANLLFGRQISNDSYYYSRFCHIWGWASWARAWKYYDVNIKRWPELRDSNWLQRKLPTPEMIKMTRQIFDDTYSGKETTWDYQLGFSVWLADAVTIIPASNLVTNIGWDAAGTHTTEVSHSLGQISAVPMEFPLRHPRVIKLSDAADMHEWASLYPHLVRRGFWRRAYQRLLLTIIRISPKKLTKRIIR
jgi:hypothetical protein